jgi:hypothetical protein
METVKSNNRSTALDSSASVMLLILWHYLIRGSEIVEMIVLDVTVSRYLICS